MRKMAIATMMAKPTNNQQRGIIMVMSRERSLINDMGKGREGSLPTIKEPIYPAC